MLLIFFSLHNTVRVRPSSEWTRSS